ncbi:MAG: ABC transporter permease, partial [Flammeovirgaceae bacterium]|nr:ABC transporter permease [Flammeovirgaceae bacterium]
MARWKQTLVAAIGVTFSISMFIGLLGFMNGLNELLDGLILNRTAHVRLFNEIEPSVYQPIQDYPRYKRSYHFIRSIKSANSRQAIYQSEAIIHEIKSDTRVVGIAPKLTAQVFFNDGSIDITGVIKGIDAKA